MTAPNPEKQIPIDAGATRDQQADELFIDGLLGAMHERSSPEASARLEKFTATLAAESSPAPRIAGRRLQRFAGVAIVLVATLVSGWVIVSATANQARATLLASIKAAKNAGERRYEVRISSESTGPLPVRPEAIFDSSGSQFLLRLHAPMGRTAIVGRDLNGEWAIRREGGIERREPRRAWPKWAVADDESIFADTVEHLMEVLTTGFELKILDNEVVDGRDMRRIQGTRRPDAPRGQADRVDLWIDPDTMLLEKMEMDWTGRPGMRGPVGEQPKPPLGPQGRPPPPPPEGAGRSDGPPPSPPVGPPPGDSPEGVRPPPHPRPPVGPPKMGIRRLVITSVAPPEWPAGWFTPEAHLDGSWGE
ncbi:MAG: hypothetical protein U0570_12855 [Phycisphaerales bacterium]